MAARLIEDPPRGSAGGDSPSERVRARVVLFGARGVPGDLEAHMIAAASEIGLEKGEQREEVRVARELDPRAEEPLDLLTVRHISSPRPAALRVAGDRATMQDARLVCQDVRGAPFLGRIAARWPGKRTPML